MFPMPAAEFEAVELHPIPPDLVASLYALMDSARRNLEADRDAARASLTRAASLLQVEIERKAFGPAPRTAPGALAAWQANRIKAYVDAHLEGPIRIPDLAAVARRSSAYFCRAFKRTFGETPHAFVVGRRLCRARELMLTSDAAMSEIAVTCGFTDQAHLCKLFRLHYGQSPAAWRREHRDVSQRGLPAARA